MVTTRGSNFDANTRCRRVSIQCKSTAMVLPGFSRRRAVSLPLIKVEVNSWGWHEHFLPNNQKPADWTAQLNCNGTVKEWPFDPYQPDPSRPRLKPFNWDINYRGPYVRIAGSLITDSPHDFTPCVVGGVTLPLIECPIDASISRFFAVTITDVSEWIGSVGDWHPGVSTSNPEHYARWTEVHPPDLIEVLNWKQPIVTVRGVALAARVAATPGPIIPSCEQVEFDIVPEGDRPANSQITYEELRGPETHFPWGENADNGSWVTVSANQIHVKARVCGGALGGSPGRFKALYRVWWQSLPPFPPMPTARDRCLQACGAVRDSCMARVGRRGGPRPRECIEEFNGCRNECQR